MKERPIIFNGEMVKAILEGRKTQTRRMANSKKYPAIDWDYAKSHKGSADWACPFGQIGDRLWVRETWQHHNENEGSFRYKATDTYWEYPWRPSIHMPRWASRITLEITGIRVERLQDISEDDAISEGIEFWEERFFDDAQDYYKDYLTKPNEERYPKPFFTCPIRSFESLWDSIYHNWNENPWVWVIDFKVIEEGGGK